MSKTAKGSDDFDLRRKCLGLAEDAHTGQFRRGDEPYLNHLVRVANKVSGYGINTECAALLYSTIRDNPRYTAQSLLDIGVPSEIVDAVVVLTKVKGQDYNEYLLAVKQNALALRVKIAAMLDNLHDQPTEKQIIKYSKGLLILHSDKSGAGIGKRDVDGIEIHEGDVISATRHDQKKRVAGKEEVIREEFSIVYWPECAMYCGVNNEGHRFWLNALYEIKIVEL